MNFSNTLKTAITAIFTNKMRSFLTMLGVIIGVASVVLLIAIGNGLTVYITQQFNDLGANTIQVAPGDIFDSNSGGFGNPDEQAAAIASNKIKYSDVSDIKKLGSPITHVAPIAQTFVNVTYQGEELKTSVVGTESAYEQALNTKAQQGSWFSETDNDTKRKVTIIGSEIQKKLFGKIDPIGKTIKISNQSFKVVGVAEEKGGGFGGPAFNTYVFIPFETFSDVFDNNQIQQIAIKVKEKEGVIIAEKMVDKLLLKRMNEEDFSVFETTEILDIISQVLGTLTLALGGIAAISLIVGGIGIMNIMLVSVTERTREIGLRKALGATPNIILLQFLIESSVLSVLGGFIGLLLAVGLSLIINNFFPAQISVFAVVLAFGVSTLIGVIFGVAPARRASKLSPIEALRYE